MLGETDACSRGRRDTGPAESAGAGNRCDPNYDGACWIPTRSTTTAKAGVATDALTPVRSTSSAMIPTGLIVTKTASLRYLHRLLRRPVIRQHTRKPYDGGPWIG
jgi:hypothetical protein